MHARAEPVREQTGERDFSEADAAIAEEVTAGEPKGGVLGVFHGSAFGDGFVEVEKRARHRCPRGAFRGVRRFDTETEQRRRI